MTLFFRYCGGCNPCYDRCKAAQLIRNSLPEQFDQEANSVDGCILLCGCFSACAKIPPEYKDKRIWLSRSQEDVLNIIKELKTLKQEAQQ
ncbi:hypothetical protein DCMF_27890 [Candidatus Formimonas warabiya]|uniref:(2Fe-2S) ferredoxin domain-containing protein n=1 Tax=Formimonas warabiya TaxID=1761012 RepID=A0A3G1L0Q6_FORW1|nr:hypothetical protein DCMF_27890 [Candidatus Formimonas warabiya]